MIDRPRASANASLAVQNETIRQRSLWLVQTVESLSNRHRLLLLCQLIEKERSVGELAEFIGIRDSTVSQHLALLRRDGLVAARRDGQTIWYSISSGPARAVLETLYRVYCSQAPDCRPKQQRKR